MLQTVMKRAMVYISIIMSCASGAVVADQGNADWANLEFYRAQNKNLQLLGPVRHRVVFMGDSITQLWDMTKIGLFSEENYVNRGISGQTTSQMLLRFHQDVITLQPEAVLILAGTNDIAGNTGGVSMEMITDNIVSMTELARLHGIKVVLCSVLPVSHYPWAPDVQPIQRVSDLNHWLKLYAQEHGFTYIDYFDSMNDGYGALKPQYTDDGVHPNATGYEVMTKIVKTSLLKVVGTD